MASHVNQLAKAVINLETAVGTLGGLRIKEVDGTPTIVPVHSITISNGTLTDLGSGEVLLTIASTSVAAQIRSTPGAWTVASTVQVGDVVRVTGNYAASKASNVDSTNGSGVVGIVTEKPTSTTASIAYSGEITVPTELVAGTYYYLGVDGAITSTPLNPVSNAGSGMVHKKVGIALNASILLLSPEAEVIL